MDNTESYVATLDIGTTTLRCLILNSKIETIGSASTNVKLIYPKPGFVEINPNELWTDIVDIIKKAITDAKLEPKDIKCLGISTQRSTFVTWNKTTGKPFHNFITWKDIRAKTLCKEINTSITLKAIRYGSYFAYLFLRSQRFLIGSKMKLAPNHVTGRFLWVIQNIPELKVAIQENNAMFGTVDTWLLYNLSEGELYVTDISNASATGFFDPFVCEWGSWAKSLLGIPINILPKIVDNDIDFGATSKDLFGVSIPIKCIMADQTSSMFASGCVMEDDIKITLGTGAFLNVNTSSTIHTSVTGIYPVIGWRLDNKIVYIGEVPCNDCGSLIQWLLNVKLINSPSEIDDMVTSVEDSDGVCFVPAFSGLGPPINDEKAASGFLGIKPTTNQNHLVRAVLEGIIYRILLAFQTLQQERNRDYKKLIVDGGVSKNNFVCQSLADLTGITIQRLHFTELSALGVAFLAGLKMTIWTSYDVLKRYNPVDKEFTPNSSPDYRQKRLKDFAIWLKAIERFKVWYEED